MSKLNFHHYWCSRNICINVGRIVLLDILVKLFQDSFISLLNMKNKSFLTHLY